MSDGHDLERLKAEILDLVRVYTEARLSGTRSREGAPVPYAGRVYDSDEVVRATDAVLDFWLTLGPHAQKFETALAKRIGVRATRLVNSGSSANLVALSALTSSRLKERQLKHGDEVITAAAGFPTTVAPIVQNGAVPVFVDVDPTTANIRVDRLADALHPGRTKAVMLAHTLGNPFDLREVTRFCAEHGLWLIEDNCDALGSLYDGRWTGSFGDASTQSFYPPHHLTMGEGGAVNIRNSGLLQLVVESFRDWGRDCWCESGKDNTCGKRFGWRLGELPEGYDHKYIYSHLGYNLKPLDVQAAIGLAQLEKLDAFVEARRRNWDFLRRELADLEDELAFMLPTHATSWQPSGFAWGDGVRTDPSWFGFMMVVRPHARFRRADLVAALEADAIGHRMLFGGNLTRQPAFVDLARQRPDAYRIVGDLQGADTLMEHAIFVGVYPGLSTSDLERIVRAVRVGAGR